MTSTTATPRSGIARPSRRRIAPIPLHRIAAVEVRKMFNTRSGFWLMASIAITSVLATVAVIIFADEDTGYTAYVTAIGLPMGVILPIVAALSVTSEWSQRSGLTTFTLIPHRGRVVLAKAIAAVSVAVVSVGLALSVGALGAILGAAINGTDPNWDSTRSAGVNFLLGNVLSLLFGLMLGVLIRSSPGAIVAYFVNSLVITGLTQVLATNNSWFEEHGNWLDYNAAQAALFESTMTDEQWAQLGVTSFLWLVLPLAIGTRILLRSEVK